MFSLVCLFIYLFVIFCSFVLSLCVLIMWAMCWFFCFFVPIVILYIMCGFSLFVYFFELLFGIFVVFGSLFVLCTWARPLGLARLFLHKYTFSFF